MSVYVCAYVCACDRTCVRACGRVMNLHSIITISVMIISEVSNTKYYNYVHRMIIFEVSNSISVYIFVELVKSGVLALNRRQQS